MTDYISREAAIALTDQHCFEIGYDAEWMETELRDLPAADVRPVVHGKWIEHGRDRPPTCSNCGSSALLNYESDYHKSDFCPHCGADMREEGE